MNINRYQSIRLRELLTEAGINTTAVKVLGPFVHIDTFRKYGTKVFDTVMAMGAKKATLAERDARGRTIDGKKTYRIIAKF